ncbi:IS66 family insertion sequence element accessory protein TnpB [Maridesulfovibrio bastinii]
MGFRSWWTIIKILYWDNKFFCLWQKRLEKNHFF